MDLTDLPLLAPLPSLFRDGEARGLTRLEEKLEGRPRRSILRLIILSSEVLLFEYVARLSLGGVWSAMLGRMLFGAYNTSHLAEFVGVRSMDSL